MAKTSKKTPTSEQPHVIVAGAGLAGLTSAYELERKGFRCTLLEADADHVGGRVRTKRFDDGQYAELGAMRIPEVHKHVLDYIDRFKLDIREFVNTSEEAYLYVRGQPRLKQRKAKAARDFYQLRPWEQTQSADDIWGSVLGPAVDSLSDAERDDLVRSTGWKTRKIHDLDQFSLHAQFERAGLSAEAIEYFAICGAYGETLLGAGFIEYLREEAEKVWLRKFYEIVGGMDRLPGAVAAALRGDLKRDCKVTAIHQDLERKKVAVEYLDGGKKAAAQIEGDYLVCSLPFSVMQDIEVTPAMSAGKQRAIRQIVYESATKVLINSSRRFWEQDDKIFGGASYTDLLIGPLFYQSDNAQCKDPKVSAGPGVIVASYNWGEAARRLGALRRDERGDLAMRQAAKVHPELLGQPGLTLTTASMAWSNFPLSRGAFSFYAPGQFSRLHRDVLSVEERVHFAGEHTSTAHTWMEGAIVSGLRVAEEIGARHGP